jgi:O-antigen/teichoic acid export membrane protein
MPAWLVGSGVIAVAMGVMNVTTYLFTLLAARLLGPSEYGQIAAAMGVLLILNVLSLGLQATGARRISSVPALVRRTEHEVLSATYRAALLIGVITLALTPIWSRIFRLDLSVAVFVALAAVPLTVMGGQAGVLQGERRWLPLAGVYAGMGIGRLVVGAVAMAIRPDAVSAMLAVAVAALVPAEVGWAAVRRGPGHQLTAADPPLAGREAGPLSDSQDRPESEDRPHARSVLGEVVRNSHALLAFFVLSNSDILVARTVLDAQQSGLYAGGLILTKAVLFLPQFVVVLVFPSMSAAPSGRNVQRKAVTLILALGLAVTAWAALLAPRAVLFGGGSEYAELEPLIWSFALLGTILAVVQLLVYGVVARQHSAGIYVLWGGLGALLLASTAVDSLGGMITTVLAVQTSVFVLLLVVGRIGTRVRAEAGTTQTTPGSGPGAPRDDRTAG